MPRKQPNPEIFDKIFELKWAEPFKPFALTLVDGQRFVIARWDTIGRSPNGKIIVFSAKGEGGFTGCPSPRSLRSRRSGPAKQCQRVRRARRGGEASVFEQRESKR